MSYSAERDECIAYLSRQGLQLPIILSLLRHATTLQRLAVAQCNGDWPAGDGLRKVVECSRCEQGWAPSSMVYDTSQAKFAGRYPLICKDCRTQDLVSALLTDTGYKPIFGGDPRGAVLRLAPVNASAEDIDSGRERGIYIPVRER